MTMIQTKFSVFYKKLWSHLKFRDKISQNKSNCKCFGDGSKEKRKGETTKINNHVGDEITQKDNEIKECEFVGLKLSTRNVPDRFTKPQNYLDEFKRRDLLDFRRNYNISSDARNFPNLSDIERRRKSDWIGDKMKNEVAKQAPGSIRSTFEVYEAGKIMSKSRIPPDCRKKEKNGFVKPKTVQKSSEECDDGESPEFEDASQCHQDKKQICVNEVEPKAPNSAKNCPSDNRPESSMRLCPPSNDVLPERRKKRLPGFNLPGKKHGFTSSSQSSSSLPVNCPSNARSSKQCAPTPRPSLPCFSPPPKRTTANSGLRCGSSVPSPPMMAASKCPPQSAGQASSRKPCVPCQSASPPPPPPTVCPQPVNPPAKSRCGSPTCSPPPCPPPPCPPPPPPPCCPPPSCPKMEALQFDPVCKTLNFYMLNAPTSIRKDEILVQIVYSGVCGTDLMIMEGKYPIKNVPVILGHEFSGIACAVGSGVSHIKCGDSIAVDPYSACHICRYCTRGQSGACINEGLNNSIGIHKDGGWAEFVVVHKNQVHLVPGCLGLGQAVLVQPLSCIVNAMSQLKIPFGADIVIQGTGVAGCLWASVLHLQGYKNVIACDINDYKRKLFQCLDLKYCILSPEKMCDIKADIVIDCTGSGKSIERGIQMLNPQGQLCIFGIPPPDDEITIQPFEIAKKEAKIISVITNTNSFSKAITLAEMMGCRYLDYEKLGMQTFKLGQYEGALKMKRNSEISKVVFKIQNSK